jgi:choline-glycine betaine transporter
MLLVAMAWIYVVLMMSVAEALAPNGTVLGALITFVLYGALPLSIVLYIMSAPARRKLRTAREAQEAQEATDRSAADPNAGGHAPGDAVAPERKEP